MATRKVLKKIIKNGQAYELPSSDDFVDLSSNQSIGGTKTFTTSPVVPSKSSTAGDNPTVIATEKQVKNVADSLSTLDGQVVKTSGNQSVGGTKTFTSEIVLPSKTTDATNDGTKPATEAQVYKKEDTLTEVTKSDIETGTSTTAGKISAKTINEYVASKTTNIYTYKGSKANYDALPTTGNVVGDVWNVEAAHTTAPKFPAGSNLAWDGTGWDVLGGSFDTSGFVDTTNNQTVGGVKTFTSEPVLPTKSTDATNDGTKPATEAQVYKKLDSLDLGNGTINVKYGTQGQVSAGSFTTNQSTAGNIIVPGTEFYTQAEYDLLGSGKATDNNSYAIYETITTD